MNHETKEETITNFYVDYDIILEVDELDKYYITDPLDLIKSPAFSKIEDLENWIFDNIKELKRKLS